MQQGEADMNGNELSLGRNHSTADSVSVVDFGDCARVDVRWNDGGYVYTIYDTKAEAVQHVHSLGWA